MKKELIDIIKDELNDFELDYRTGAWEDFYKQEKKKSPRIISLKRFAIAAAVILVALFLFLIAGKYLQKKQQNIIVLKVPFKNMPVIKVLPQSPGKYVQYKHRQHYQPNPAVHPDKGLADILSAMQLKRIPPTIGDTINTNPGIQFLAVLPTSLVPPANTLAKHLPSHQNSEFRKRWQLGLSVGNGVSYGQEHQFGAGAFVTYQLSHRLAFSSGFYFNQLGALKNVAHDNNFSDPEKVLTNIKVNLGGLEIPFELKYKLTRRFYTKFGASLYSIKSQQQQLIFTRAESSIVNYIDPTGTAFSETLVTAGYAVAEAVPPSQLEKNKLISIYNFSVGYEYPILHGQKLFIEPFIKLPNKEFSVYRVNLAQTGIRLNVSF
ncbi:hypothetical protein [Mucilaginibacter sp. SG564]|uniref:hypothetical protein n=1 Tax=unclassified Mucilaginibacter TaxID=2617802 RepID=UPI001554349B|nr:hypothetical protein [Mucilaginibacter sp. SG564]NOW96143.1 hypothetical protein [Mucilaginibacter sp. SG564]